MSATREASPSAPLLLAYGPKELRNPESECARHGITPQPGAITLRATHENTTQSNNTIIGHSYGSTVVGHTAQSEAGLNADKIILVGSPGANAQHASELGFLPENVHASTAKNDGITAFTDLTHGADPTSPDFGATVFKSDKGSEGGSFPLGDAHSEYFKEGSLSLKYMGKIIAGQ